LHELICFFLFTFNSESTFAAGNCDNQSPTYFNVQRHDTINHPMLRVFPDSNFCLLNCQIVTGETFGLIKRLLNLDNTMFDLNKYFTLPKYFYFRLVDMLY